MAVKKTQLYRSLWDSCDELRGGMDASQYKDYILTLLFLKYVSDKYAGDPLAPIIIPEGGSFADLVNLKGDSEIGDKINKIISRLAEENNLKGVIDQADFNDEDKLGRGKEMVDRLSKLIGIFQGIDLGANRAEGDDLLGDAYEYLMRNFATESGKSKGQFYTPAEVSRIMAKIIGIGTETTASHTVYDPTCGSGSLLLKAANEAPKGISIYGQEKDNATQALAKMNMILHDNPTAEIWQGNTLSEPHWLEEDGSLKLFDFAVANPPFSYKSWSRGFDPENDSFNRFEYGMPPSRNGDYAFLLHLLKSLKSTGKGAIVMPHGVLFRGNAEADIRRNLIRQGVIKGIIGLPPNLFYGTGIPACIIVLEKENAQHRSGIFMIDASRGFIKDGNKNRLRERDIHKIVTVFLNREDLPGYARMVSFAEIEENDFNLNIPRYIDSSEPEDLQDLDAHLNGGIPLRDIDDLAPYWDVFPSLRPALFAPGEREGYCQIRVVPGEIKSTILNHQEFVNFKDHVLKIFEGWWTAHQGHLEGLDGQTSPKALIKDISEDLLARFASVRLLDKYAIYQLLMDYWQDTLQDDLYMIVQEGWEGANRIRVIEKKDGKYQEDHDFTIGRVRYKADLIPPNLIIRHYFHSEKDALEALQESAETLAQDIDQIALERSGEEDILADVVEEGKSLKSTDLKAQITDYEVLALDRFAPDLSRAITTHEKTLATQEKAFADLIESQWQYLEGTKGKSGSPTLGNIRSRISELEGKETPLSGEESVELGVLHAYLHQYDLIKATKKAHKAAIKKGRKRLEALIKQNPEAPEIKDLLALRELLQKMDDQRELEKETKAAQDALDEAVRDQYPKMTEAEIREITITDKWRQTLRGELWDEVERITQRLTTRVQELEARYAEPLPEIKSDVEALSARVEDHLKKMGITW
jgi:type I restriction enzyme M protein